jgi:hypothetical protein
MKPNFIYFNAYVLQVGEVWASEGGGESRKRGRYACFTSKYKYSALLSTSSLFLKLPWGINR